MSAESYAENLDNDNLDNDKQKENPESATPDRKNARVRAWSQQSAKAPDTSTADTSTITSAKKTRRVRRWPWQQQSASSRSRPQRLIRVRIDPVSGRHVEIGSSLDPEQEYAIMSFEQRQEDLMQWGFWEQEGRIGLSVAKDTYNGSLSWEQEGDTVDFRFRGPLGFGGVRIHGVLGESIRIKTTRGEEFILKDVEVEMQEQMGWSLPINSLRYWTLGITDPEQDAEVVLNEDDLLDEVVQGEWTVVYDSYQDVDDVSLPRKFNITGPKTRIRMIVNQWVIPGDYSGG